jgi:cellulose synthase/poly-beta-1,6-N-acetylglucosamine synthase-like glycosyltransferase
MTSPAGSIAVIVPTTGSRDLTELNEAICRQTRPADEIIVIEDRARRGGAWARNRGIERSSAQLLAFLDDDCIPPPQWLDSLAAAIARFDAAGAGGTYSEEDPFLHARRCRQNYPSAELIDSVGWVGAGGNVAYRRAVLEQLRARDGHYFNEAFRISEDKELAWRVRARGGQLVFVPVEVRHTKRCIGWTYVKQQFGRGIGIAGLHWAARADRDSAPPDRGLLWAQRGRPTAAAWLRIFALKAVGPFDRRSFGTTAHFLLFWIGEKSQGLGFLWGLIWRPFARRGGLQ